MDRDKNLGKSEFKQYYSGIKEKWFKNFPTPESILTDQGRQFISNHYHEFLRKYSIKPIITSRYNPTCNSVVERINGTIVNVARISKNLSFEELQKIITNYLNFTVNRNMGIHFSKLFIKKTP